MVTPLVSSILAYVGPGAGLGALGALWALLVSVVVALGVIIAWPVKRMLRRSRAANRDAVPAAAQEQD